VGEVTADQLRAYLVELQGRNLAPRTVHHHASAARTLFSFLEYEGLLPAGNPMRRVKMPRLPKELLPALTPEDVRALLTACDCERDRAFVLFLLDTGVRASECAALNIADVNITTGAVMVRAGKGRKDRMVYVGSRARKGLLRYLAERGPAQPGAALWVSLGREERLTTWGLRQILERLSVRSGVRPVNPHTFRRTFALWSLRAGMDLVRLAAIMGHSDIKILQRYLKVAEQDLQAAHDAHGAVDKLLR
jgi:site-specific recombinase XerD